MSFFTYAFTYSAGLLVGLAACLKIGHLMGRRHRAAAKENGGGALDGVVFAVLGLLLAFSFSASIDTYTTHRSLLTREANDIGTAFAKIDLLPTEDQAALREMLLEYAQTRLAATEAQVGSEEERAALETSRRAEDQIWTRVAKAVKQPGMESALLAVVDSFVRLTDATADQQAEERNHLPKVIYGLVFILCMMAALVAGFGLGAIAKIPLIRTVVFSLSVVAIMHVIIDLEYPRSGIFQSSRENVALRETLADMRALQSLRLSGH